MCGCGENSLPETIPNFSTQDINGNIVTQRFFSKKDLTVVNVWSNTCDGCVEELPDLEKFSTALPDNVQMVGVVLEDNSDEDSAKTKEICTTAYPQLISKDTLKDELGSKIHVTPTTFFVNKEGKIVGDTVTGNNGDTSKLKEKMEEALNGQN